RKALSRRSCWRKSSYQENNNCQKRNCQVWLLGNKIVVWKRDCQVFGYW
ncbi:21515_t:CDS:1, partial [Gigaspora rosea]